MRLGKLIVIWLALGLPVVAHAQSAPQKQRQIAGCILLGGDPASREFARCLVDRYGWSVERAARVIADTLRQREVDAFAASLDSTSSQREWVSSDSTWLFYRRTCAAAKRIPPQALRVWSDTTGARNIGMHHSTDPGC